MGFALCHYEKGGREMLICEQGGRVSLMTMEEVEAEGGGPSIFSQVVENADGANFG